MHKVVCRDARRSEAISPYVFFSFHIFIVCDLARGERLIGGFDIQEDAERYANQKATELGLACEFWGDAFDKKKKK